MQNKNHLRNAKVPDDFLCAIKIFITFSSQTNFSFERENRIL